MKGRLLYGTIGRWLEQLLADGTGTAGALWLCMNTVLCTNDVRITPQGLLVLDGVKIFAKANLAKTTLTTNNKQIKQLRDHHHGGQYPR